MFNLLVCLLHYIILSYYIMPYSIRKIGKNKYQVYNTATGELHSKGTTKKKAEGQFRLLQGVHRKELLGDLEGGSNPRRQTPYRTAEQFREAIINARRHYTRIDPPANPQGNRSVLLQQFENLRPQGVSDVEWETLIRYIAGLEPEDMIDEWDDFLDDEDARRAMQDFGMNSGRMDDAVRRMRTIEELQSGSSGSNSDDEMEVEGGMRRRGGAKRSRTPFEWQQERQRILDRLDELDARNEVLIQETENVVRHQTPDLPDNLLQDEPHENFITKYEIFSEFIESESHNRDFNFPAFEGELDDVWGWIRTIPHSIIQSSIARDKQRDAIRAEMDELEIDLEEVVDTEARENDMDDDDTGDEMEGWGRRRGGGQYSTASPEYQPRRFL